MSKLDPAAKFFDNAVAFPVGGSNPTAVMKAARMALGAAVAGVTLTFMSAPAGASPIVMQVAAEQPGAPALEMDQDFVEIASDVAGLWAPEQTALDAVKKLEAASRAQGVLMEASTDSYKIAFDAKTGSGYVLLKKGVFNLSENLVIAEMNSLTGTSVSSREGLDAVRAAMIIAKGADGATPDLGRLLSSTGAAAPAVDRTSTPAPSVDRTFLELSHRVLGLWTPEKDIDAKLDGLTLDGKMFGGTGEIDGARYKIAFDDRTGEGAITLKQGAWNLPQDTVLARISGGRTALVSSRLLDAIDHSYAIAEGADGQSADLSDLVTGEAKTFLPMDGDFVEIASDVTGLYASDDKALEMVKKIEADSKAAGKAVELETAHYRINYDATTGDGYVALKKGEYGLAQDTLVLTTKGDASSEVASWPALNAVRKDHSIVRGMNGQSDDLSRLLPGGPDAPVAPPSLSAAPVAPIDFGALDVGAAKPSAQQAEIDAALKRNADAAGAPYGIRTEPEQEEAPSNAVLPQADPQDRSDFEFLVKSAITAQSGSASDPDDVVHGINAALNACVLSGMTPCSVTAKSIEVSYAKGALTLSSLDADGRHPVVSLNQEGLGMEDATRFAKLLGVIDERKAADLLDRAPQPSEGPGDRLQAEPAGFRNISFLGDTIGAAAGRFMGPLGGAVMNGARQGIEKLRGQPTTRTKAPDSKPRPKRRSAAAEGVHAAEVVETAEVEMNEAPAMRI